ncbi:MAG: SDR family NAD(P)-dependent oxidoreductase, partial [Candidatus Nanopelagicales bacterium]
LLARADLRDPEAARGLVDGIATHWDGLDVLVNNAGIFEAHPIDETDFEEWQRRWTEAIAVNLVGPANVTWAAVRH